MVYKMYMVKKFESFPKRSGKDILIGSYTVLKEAQSVAIGLNKANSDRYYVCEVEKVG